MGKLDVYIYVNILDISKKYIDILCMWVLICITITLKVINKGDKYDWSW
jgi:hypothetical protein